MAESEKVNNDDLKNRKLLEKKLDVLMTYNSLLLSRQATMQRNLIDPSGRDLDKECGYPIGEPGPTFYQDMFYKVGIAHRVVGVYPSECWSVYPELYERDDEEITAFEQKWNELNTDNAVWSYLDRIDEMSGIGRFGCLFLGLEDNKAPHEPADGINERGMPSGVKVENKLMFMRAFDEANCRIAGYEMDFNNPRFGQPTLYHLYVDQPAASQDPTDEGPGTNKRTSITVHWTRVIHVTDNRKGSEVYGMPRMRPVIPEIMDIRKIRGSSAEMFWQGGFPGFSLETTPDLGMELELDKESAAEEFEKWRNGLQRFMAFQGVTAKSLAPQVSDPTNHLASNYLSIAATIGVPMKVLLGSEAGHLASTQDLGMWNRRLAKRQNIYIVPNIIRPFVNRMVMLGVLPKPEKFDVAWIDLNSMSSKDKADVALKQTQSMMTYVTGGCEQIMPVLEYYIEVLGLTTGQAQAIIKKAKRKSRKMLVDPMQGQPVKEPTPQGGGRNGGDQQGEQGRPRNDATGQSSK